MRVLAIDPGTTQSAWVLFDPSEPLRFGIWSNDDVLVDVVRPQKFAPELGTTVVIEKVESFGMAVGAEVFETVFWAGRFAEAAYPMPVDRIGRKAVKLHLCQSTRATDSNIRAALIDRYGGSDAIRKGGALYGVSKDVWAALAVGVTWLDQHPPSAPETALPAPEAV